MPHLIKVTLNGLFLTFLMMTLIQINLMTLCLRGLQLLCLTPGLLILFPIMQKTALLNILSTELPRLLFIILPTGVRTDRLVCFSWEPLPKLCSALTIPAKLTTSGLCAVLIPCRISSRPKMPELSAMFSMCLRAAALSQSRLWFLPAQN